MASATGSFRFLTKKNVSNMILTLYEGFFQINFRWLFKVIFLLRADYQAQIETQLSNKKFITIMASATGSFCFLTKKKCLLHDFGSLRVVFSKQFQMTFQSDTFFPHLYTIKIMKFSKKHKIRCERSLVILPGCFWILEIAYHSAVEIAPFFCFFHFFSRSQNVWNSNFVNKKSEKLYFFFNCDIFF